MKYISNDEIVVLSVTISAMCLLALTLFAQPISACVAEKNRQGTVQYRKSLTQ